MGILREKGAIIISNINNDRIDQADNFSFCEALESAHQTHHAVPRVRPRALEH